MLIFWKGRGILIPVFIVFGGLVTFAVGIALDAFLFHSNLPFLHLCTAFAGAVLGAHLCARTVCKTEYQRVIEPGTHRPMLLVRKHTFYFISAPVWPVLVAIIGVVSAGIMGMREASSPLRTVAPEVRQAVDHLQGEIEAVLGRHSVDESWGNVPAAKQLAAEFYLSWSNVIGKGLNTSDAARPSVVRGLKLRCYCVMTQTQCAFILNALDTEPLGKDATSVLRAAAWMEAPAAVQRLGSSIERITIVIDRVFSDISTRLLNGQADFAEPVADYEALLLSLVQDLPYAGSTSSKPSSDVTGGGSVAKHKASPSVAKMEPKQEPVSALPTTIRDWKDGTGRPLRASLMGFTTDQKDIGIFNREDGQSFNIPIERFSDADQTFIRSLVSPSENQQARQ